MHNNARQNYPNLTHASYVTGARINTIAGIPRRLYWTSSARAEKDVYVIVCPPKASVFDEAKERGYIAAGFCPGRYGYIMKHIAAARDDVASITDQGVRVNGQLLALSARESCRHVQIKRKTAA